MTEYRIGERDRRFWIEVKSNKAWVSLNQTGVPRYFDSLADARSWVATIKRGVVYHDAEDAPNLAQDDRKAEDEHLCIFNRAMNGECMVCGDRKEYTKNFAEDEECSCCLRPPRWFVERIGEYVLANYANEPVRIKAELASVFEANQYFLGHRFKD
jgi:hypothetical protein